MQMCHHCLQVLAAHSFNSSMHFLPILKFFSVPLRHHLCQRNGAVALDSFRQCTSFTIFHELGASIWPMKRSLKTPQNRVNLLQKQLLDHLAYLYIFRSVDLDFRHLCPTLFSTLRLSSVDCRSSFFWTFQFLFLALLLSHLDKCTRRATALSFFFLAIRLCLPWTCRWSATLLLSTLLLNTFMHFAATSSSFPTLLLV